MKYLEVVARSGHTHRKRLNSLLTVHRPLDSAQSRLEVSPSSLFQHSSRGWRRRSEETQEKGREGHVSLFEIEVGAELYKDGFDINSDRQKGE